MVVFLLITAANMFSMEYMSEGVATPEHIEDIRRAEENRQREEMLRQLRQDREQAHRQRMEQARLNRVERQLAEQQYDQGDRQPAGIVRRLDFNQ